MLSKVGMGGLGGHGRGISGRRCVAGPDTLARLI
jgi:hypothetical protein